MDHGRYGHESILSFLSYRFGLGFLTKRHQTANNIGRGHATCTIIDRRYAGQDCDFVLVLSDGTVTASGGGLDRLLPGQSPSPPHAPDEFAVTGGTGAYRDASGTLSLQEHADGSSTLTVSL